MSVIVGQKYGKLTVKKLAVSGNANQTFIFTEEEESRFATSGCIMETSKNGPLKLDTTESTPIEFL